MKTLLALLALKDTASEAEAVAAVNALFATAKENKAEIEALKAKLSEGDKEIVTLAGAKDRSEAVTKFGALQAALKDSTAQVTVLSAKLEKLEAERLEAEVTSLVAEGMREGKIAPAQKDLWLKTGRASLSILKEYLSTAPKLVATEPLKPPPPRRPAAPASPTR
jgi:phage I-like protein